MTDLATLAAAFPKWREQPMPDPFKIKRAAPKPSQTERITPAARTAQITKREAGRQRRLAQAARIDALIEATRNQPRAACGRHAKNLTPEAERRRLYSRAYQRIQRAAKQAAKQAKAEGIS